MNRVVAWLRTQQGRIVVRDVVVSAGAGYAVFQTSGGHYSWGLLAAAAMAALKALLRKLVPDLPAILGIDASGITGKQVIVTPERRVDGQRLGRHVEHDERSRAYAVTPRADAVLHSIRHHRHTPVFDQGDVGSCTGNAMAGALSTAPFTHRFREARALKLYAAATALDDIPGVYPPDDTGSSGLAVAKAAHQAGLIGSYQHAFTVEAVLAALQDGPVILGVNWREGFDTPDADGRMRLAGAVRGGHEIVADEVDVPNQRVWITNSWGDRWGLAGRAWWTWADLRAVLADYGDAVVPRP